MLMPVLQTRIKVPPVRPRRVARPGLVIRMNQGLQNKLLLIAAPAGYGKTTLVVDWLAQLPPDFACAWLSLDEGDNDGRRFLNYLIAALEQVQTGFGAAVRALLQAPQPPPDEAVMTVLINELAALPRPHILVLDDYHFIHALQIHKQVAFLLDHQPANFHLVLATREDPLLPVARLRAQGQVIEIHQDDLRFTLAEVAEFLQNLMGLPLSAGEIATLGRRTEGWIAGLQMAALSMEGRDDLAGFVQSFTGSSRFILDYLIEEVFRRQTPETQDFLLQSSILARLSGPLCAAVTNQANSQALLEKLEQANLFVIPLDQSRTWYRYHQLFADLLQHYLHASHPGLAVELHRRASHWFKEAGMIDEAIQHALLAQAWDEAARLIGQIGESLLNRGELTTLIGWVQQLPQTLLLAIPSLGLGYAWALMISGRYREAETLLAHYEKTGTADPLLMGRLYNAQAFAARAAGDNRGLIEKSEQALALLPDSEAPTRCLLALNLGLAYWHEGRLREVGPALDEAETLAVKVGNDYARLTSQIFRARTLASQGSLHRAEVIYHSLAQQAPGVAILSLVHYDLACIYQEWGEDDKAWAHLEQGLGICERGANAEFQNAGRLQKTLFWLAQGDIQAALAEIEKAHALAAGFSQVTQARSFAAHALVALAQGDLAGARTWLEKMPADGDPHSLYRFAGLTRARLLLAEAKVADARQDLARLDEQASAAGWGYARVAILTLRALAAGTQSAALAFLQEALLMAQPEGFIRTFVEAGPGLVPLLREAARLGHAPAYVGQILLACKPAATQSAGLPPAESLSDRELEVLRLVTAGLSNREIARQLVVSPGTVKTHIHHICGKLGVRNRTEAAMRAKVMDLV